MSRTDNIVLELEASDSSDRIFLGSADNEASDDVRDTHPARQRPGFNRLRRSRTVLTSGVSTGAYFKKSL